MRIGLDVMGGDFVPHAPIGGVGKVLPGLAADVTLVLIGDEQVVRAEMARHGLSEGPQLQVVHAATAIGMDEHAAQAVKSKGDSSIGVGLQLMKEGQLDAFISAGNTGAMMVGSVIRLGLIEGVSRPTVGALYPYRGQFKMIVDVGANTDCKPEQLVQFGVLGSIFMQAVFGIERPRVALLNIGEEETKGNQVAQQAYQLMKAQEQVNFVGNAEGRDLNRDHADVYVCDGFTGNILLKFGESFYDVLKDKIQNDNDVENLNFERIGGLPFLGVKGTVIVGHGISGEMAFENMVRQAEHIVRSNLNQRIAQTLGAVA